MLGGGGHFHARRGRPLPCSEGKATSMLGGEGHFPGLHPQDLPILRERSEIP